MNRRGRNLCLDICDYRNRFICNLYDSARDLSGQATDVVVTTERNGWKELSFKLPSTCQGEDGEEENYRIQYLIADYRLRVKDDYETDWFLISEPKVTHSAFSKNIDVKATHVCQLLKTKNLNLEFNDAEGNNVGTAKDLLTTILDGTGWKVGEVAEFLEEDTPEPTEKIRSLECSAGTGAFRMVEMMCEKFDAKPVYHAESYPLLQENPGDMDTNYSAYCKLSETGTVSRPSGPCRYMGGLYYTYEQLTEPTVYEDGLYYWYKTYSVDILPMNPFSEDLEEGEIPNLVVSGDRQAIELHYEKNLKDVTRTLNTENIVTKLYPYGSYGDMNGMCSIQTAVHNEYQYVMQYAMPAGSEFRIKDDYGAIRYFVVTDDIEPGDLLIWSKLDFTSRSYVWNDRSRVAYSLTKEPKNDYYLIEDYAIRNQITFTLTADAAIVTEIPAEERELTEEEQIMARYSTDTEYVEYKKTTERYTTANEYQKAALIRRWTADWNAYYLSTQPTRKVNWIHDFYFTDDLGETHYVTIDEELSAGSVLRWDFTVKKMTSSSSSATYDTTVIPIEDAADLSFYAEKDSESETFTYSYVVTKQNYFPALFNFDYYEKIGLLDDEMKQALATYQRDMVEYYKISQAAAEQLANGLTELSNVANSQTGFLRLAISGYTVNEDKSVTMTIDTSRGDNGVLYRSDYLESKKNYFEWHIAKQLKSNGDPTSGTPSALFIVHDTDPVSWERVYLKQIDDRMTEYGYPADYDYGLNMGDEPKKITVWGSMNTEEKGVIPPWKSTDRFYLFCTVSMSGKLGALQLQDEAIVQQQITTSTAVSTEVHPFYFVDNRWTDSLDNPLEPPTASVAVENAYGWFYRYYPMEDRAGDLYFCGPKDKEWHYVYMQENTPSIEDNPDYATNLAAALEEHLNYLKENDTAYTEATAEEQEEMVAKWTDAFTKYYHSAHMSDQPADAGAYFFNTKLRTLWVLSDGVWVELETASDRRMTTCFSQVWYLCRRRDQLYKGLFERYEYTVEGLTLPVGRYLIPSGYDYWWAFTTDKMIPIDSKIWVDTAYNYVYQDDDVANIVQATTVPQYSVKPMESNIISADLFSPGWVSSTDGHEITVDDTVTNQVVSRYIEVYPGNGYETNLPETAIIVFYDQAKKYRGWWKTNNTTFIVPEQTTVDYDSPEYKPDARYVRIAIPVDYKVELGETGGLTPEQWKALPENADVAAYLDENGFVLLVEDKYDTSTNTTTAIFYYYNTTLLDTYYVRIQGYESKAFINDNYKLPYTMLTPVSTAGDLKGLNNLTKTFADLSDTIYFDYVTALKNAQAKITEEDNKLANLLGDMFREGRWQETDYVAGDEAKLYRDGLDNLKEIAHPEATYNISYLDLYGANLDMAFSADEEEPVSWPDIQITDAIHLVDPEIDINCWAYIDKIDKCYDKPWETQISINTQLSLIGQHDFTDVMTRIAEVASTAKNKQALLNRINEITNEEGFVYASKLIGEWEAKLKSTESSWYTDRHGNIVFEAADGTSAMMLTGAGYCISNRKDEWGDWVYTTMATGDGIAAEKIVAGYLNVQRIENYSITTEKLSSFVGADLDISANKTLSLFATADGKKPAGSLRTNDSIIEITSGVTGVRPAQVNVMSGGEVNLRAGAYETRYTLVEEDPGDIGANYQDYYTKSTIDGEDVYTQLEDSTHIWAENIYYTAEVFKSRAGGVINIESGGELNLSGAELNMTASGSVNITGGSSINILAGVEGQPSGKFTVESGNFEIDENGNVKMKGHIEAYSGYIAGFLIEEDINSGHIVYAQENTNRMVYLGTDKLMLGDVVRNVSGGTGAVSYTTADLQNQGSGFYADINGNVYMSGEIRATAGNIAGWHIGDSYLAGGLIEGSESSRNNYKVGLASTWTTENPIVFWAGRTKYELLTSDPGDMNTNFASYYTKNTVDGKDVYTQLTSAATFATNTYYKSQIGTAFSVAADGTTTISKGSFNIGGGNFTVTNDGVVTANKGSIAGWTIGDQTLVNENTGEITGHRYFIGNADTLTLSTIGLMSAGIGSEDVVIWAGGTRASSATPFKVTGTGKLSVSNVEITGGSIRITNNNTVAFQVTNTGALTATSGTVGGWYIGSGYIGNKSTWQSSTVGMVSSETTGVGVFWAGGVYSGVPPFYVTADGYVHASNINIAGGQLTIGSTFSVSNTGVITASSGTIGGWAINSSHIGNNAVLASATVGMCPSTANGAIAFWAGNVYNAAASIPFYVTNNGYLKATNASISGTLTAGDGSKIGNWVVDGGSLKNTYTNSDGVTVSTTLSANGSGSYFINIRGTSDPGSAIEMTHPIFRVNHDGDVLVGGNFLLINGTRSSGSYTNISTIIFGDTASSYPRIINRMKSNGKWQLVWRPNSSASSEVELAVES